jgi:hypothetical protein
VLRKACLYPLVYASRGDEASFLTVMIRAVCWSCSVGARRVRDVRSPQEHIAVAADIRADAV